VSAPGWIPPKTLQHVLAEQEMRAADLPGWWPAPGSQVSPGDAVQAADGWCAPSETVWSDGPPRVPLPDVPPAVRGGVKYGEPIPAGTYEAGLFEAMNAPAYPSATQQIVQAALIKQNEAADALLALCPHAALGATAQHAAKHQGEPCPYWIALAHLTGQPDPRERIAEWRVEVPFKDGKPPLSLNDRLSWPAHASKVERIKALTRRALIDAEIPPLEQAHIEMHYRPKTRQLCDVDNLVATLKPMIDAFHQPDARSGWVGLLAGDDARYVSWSPPVLHEPDKAKGPATWLVVRTSLETR
jgi:crossover junction endodeoxyribonuclease RusA